MRISLSLHLNYVNDKCNWFVDLRFDAHPTAKVIWKRDEFIVSSDRLKKPGIKPAIPGLQVSLNNHCATEACLIVFVYIKLQFIMIVIVLSNVKKDEKTHALNTNCFRLAKQQCGMITDPT